MREGIHVVMAGYDNQPGCVVRGTRRRSIWRSALTPAAVAQGALAAGRTPLCWTQPCRIFWSPGLFVPNHWRGCHQRALSTSEKHRGTLCIAKERPCCCTSLLYRWRCEPRGSGFASRTVGVEVTRGGGRSAGLEPTTCGSKKRPKPAWKACHRPVRAWLVDAG